MGHTYRVLLITYLYITDGIYKCCLKQKEQVPIHLGLGLTDQAACKWQDLKPSSAPCCPHPPSPSPSGHASGQICKTCYGHLRKSAEPKIGIMSLGILFISSGADLMANHGMLHFTNYFCTCQILWKEIKYCKKEIICSENLCQEQKVTDTQWVPFYQQCISIIQLVLFPKVTLRSKHWRMNLHKQKLCGSVNFFFFTVLS